MGELAVIITETAMTALILYLPRLMRLKRETAESFCAGFCMAEAISGLCGRCAWTYSVVFGEMMGLVMLSITTLGALLLFELLSGRHSGLLLTSLYIFFSSADSEYIAYEKPIINASAQGIRMGCAGLKEAEGRKTVLLLLCAAAGNIAGTFSARMPAAFSVIAACGLLSKAIKDISSDRYCMIGAAAACVLVYL